MSSSLRRCLVQAIVLLQQKGALSMVGVLPLYLRLLSSPDKTVRSLLHGSISSTIKHLNVNKREVQSTHAIQTILYNAVSNDSSDLHFTTRRVLTLLCGAWLRNQWTTSRTADVILSAAFHPDQGTYRLALRFALSSQTPSSEEAVDTVDTSSKLSLEDAQLAKGSKKTKAKMRKAEAVLKKVKKQQQGEGDDLPKKVNMSLLRSVANPVLHAEKLVKIAAGMKCPRLSVKNFVEGGEDASTPAALGSGTMLPKRPYEDRLEALECAAALCSVHSLPILALYPALVRWLLPHQREVPRVLAAAATACLPCVPDDVLQTLSDAICSRFISDTGSVEVCAAGLRALGAMIARSPSCINAEHIAIVADLRRSKEKAVSTGVAAVLEALRWHAPQLLPNRLKGKWHGEESSLAFGHEARPDRIDGANLLEEQEVIDGDKEGSEAERQAEEDWEVASSSSSSSGSWIDMPEEDAAGVNLTSDSDADSDAESEEERKGRGGMHGGEEEEEVPRLVSTVPIEQRRILTPKDFARLRELREQANRDAIAGKRGGKSKQMEPTGMDERVIPGDVDAGRVQFGKRSREERMAAIMAGREDREKFGSKRGQHAGGTTNAVKDKRKGQMQVLHSRKVREKMEMSFVEKQALHTKKKPRYNK